MILYKNKIFGYLVTHLDELICTMILDRRFVCPNCPNRSYKWKKGLLQHLTYECGKKPQFGCPFPTCDYRANLKGNLTHHMKVRHRYFSNRRHPLDIRNNSVNYIH